MSTIVAVKKNKEIVIGADTMTKFGRTKQSSEYIANSSKIVKFGDNYMAFVGDASLGLVLTSYFNAQKEPVKLETPQGIFEEARKLHIALKEDYFVNPHEDDDDAFESSQMEVLIANKSGIYGLYELRSVDEFAKFYSLGTGYRYALGAMRALYNSAATAEEIARAGLEAAADFDDSTSAPFELHTINID